MLLTLTTNLIQSRTSIPRISKIIIRINLIFGCRSEVSIIRRAGNTRVFDDGFFGVGNGKPGGSFIAIGTAFGTVVAFGEGGACIICE